MELRNIKQKDDLLAKFNILVVDDEVGICNFIEDLLEDFAVIYPALNGASAKTIAAEVPIDLILLDLLMPGTSGLEAGIYFRSNSKTCSLPLVMMTGRDEATERTKAFEAGFDDFIAKPFSPQEFTARIKSKLLRRSEFKQREDQADTNLSYGDLDIDLRDLRVTVNKRPVDIGSIEFKVLYLLAQSGGATVPRIKIENFVWGGDKPSERALDPHIFSIRRKLKGSNLRLTTSYRGGYSLQNNSNQES